MIRKTRITFAAVIVALALVGGSQAEVATASVAHFANCTAMHHVYPHGVGKVGARDHVRGKTKPVTNFYRSNALYAANSRMDADHDGIACEAH